MVARNKKAGLEKMSRMWIAREEEVVHFRLLENNGGGRTWNARWGGRKEARTYWRKAFMMGSTRREIKLAG